MSIWYEPKKEDIYFSDDKKELIAYLYSDGGAVYVSLKVEDVKEALESIK